ncbi:MAG TPA: glycosyltransferase family 39 protein [Pyrinomonadaceae bacterium]|nr:glycosyltransferase family 39 protein [Pyrinomonadaceae bacterium]
MKSNLVADRRAVALACMAIFLCSLAVRVFHWQDNREPPFNGMTGEYEAHGELLARGDIRGFVYGPNPPSDANVIKHPPGYPLLFAAIKRFFGPSANTWLRLLHIIADSLAAIVIFFLAYEFFRFRVATLAGMLIAFSPQLAYHSVALLPDPLAAPPLVLGLYLIVRAYKSPKFFTLFAAGVMIGISCWLRSNILLLPLFVCAVLPVLFKPGVRMRSSAALLAGFLLLIVPVTIRNYVYFRSFIPISLSAGITLVEGIGVNDRDHRFGLPDNDYLVSKWEAEKFQRPDYLANRFGVDGVMRERFRVQSGLKIIAHHPFWFSNVMLNRAASMLRLARVELIRSQPAITHSLNAPAAPSVVIKTAADPGATAGFVKVDQPRGSANLGRATAQPDTDYVLRVPLLIEHGGVAIEVVSAADNKTLAISPDYYPVNWLDLSENNQVTRTINLAFVSDTANEIQVKLTTEHGPFLARVGEVELVSLGHASYTWTRYPRLLFRTIEKVFLTAVMLPLTMIGLIVLIKRKQWVPLAVLTIVPIYYMCVQSALWTEFRYILSMHYFLFVLAAVGFIWLYEQARLLILHRRRESPR